MQVELTPARRAARRKLARHGVLVLYEDNHLIGLSKPSGLLSLFETARGDKLEDRNVSGAMVVARTSKAAARLSKAFRDRAPELEKTYLAWVERIPAEPQAELVHRLRREGGVTLIAAAGDDDGREARLSYTVVARGHNAARLEVRLHTGLPHQIRCQLAFVGHPILGDVKYGGQPAKRPALHALQLVLPHPVGGERLVIVAPVPKDLVKIDERRRLVPPV